MLKGVQARRSIHIILCALKNNKDVFENILNKQIIKETYEPNTSSSIAFFSNGLYSIVFPGS